VLFMGNARLVIPNAKEKGKAAAPEFGGGH